MFTITTITLWLICWFITEYTLIQNFISNSPSNNYWINEILQIFTCWKCTTFNVFIIGSLITLSPTLFSAAFIYSFASMLITKILNKL